MLVSRSRRVTSYTPPAPSGLTVFDPATDMSYLGNFAITGSYWNALTGYYKSGQLCLMTFYKGAGYGFGAYEVPDDSDLSLTAPTVVQSQVGNWSWEQVNGLIGFNTDTQYPWYPTSAYNYITQLHFDSDSGQMYWLFGFSPGAVSNVPMMVTIARTPFNPATDTFGTPEGPWHMKDGDGTVIPFTRVWTGFIPSTPTFKSTCLPNHEDFLIGMGGYNSAESAGGGISQGPSLWALDSSQFDSVTPGVPVQISTTVTTSGSSTTVSCSGGPDLSLIVAGKAAWLWADFGAGLTYKPITGADNTGKTITITSAVNVASPLDALITITPTNLADGSLDADEALQTGPLIMSHPFNPTPDTYPSGSGPFPMRRDDDYQFPNCNNVPGPPWPGPGNLGWPKQGSTGFANWFDGCYGNMIMIEGSAKWGLLGVWNSSQDDVWYGFREPDNLGNGSSGHCIGAKYDLRVYDPADLKSVIDGDLRSDLLNPLHYKTYQNLSLLNDIYIQNNDGTQATIPFAGAPTGDQVAQAVTGTWFDETTDRWYWIIDHSYHPGGVGDYATIHVFQLNLD